MTICFTILGEPASKANSRQIVNFPRFSKKQQRKIPMPVSIKSEKARDYEKSAMLQIPDHARQMLTGPVRVKLRIFYTSERSDLDESVVLDCMQAQFKKKKSKPVSTGNDGEYEQQSERVMIARGVYVNDRQVREKHIYHGIDKINPRTEIEVSSMPKSQMDLGNWRNKMLSAYDAASSRIREKLPARKVPDPF